MRIILSIAVVVSGLAGCRAARPTVTEVVAVRAEKLPVSPGDTAWTSFPEHVAKLLPQDLVDPRLMTASTAEVRVQAATSGSEVAFRLSWADPAINDLPGPGRFLDGCAIQIPRAIEANPPDPQMGQAGKAVDIVFWRADWQASVNGRKDTIQSLYPNATIDHYPFEAKPLEPGSDVRKEAETRYAPAAAVGNRRSGPRESPVEDLVAEGPGTLSANSGARSHGRGERTPQGWSVVIVRRTPDGWAPRTRTQVAFAVWEGSAKEAGARKMRTGWIPLSLRETAP